MAETNVAGLGGTIALPTDYNIHVTSWSASFAIETVDVTTFASGGFREFEPTIVNMTGSFAGHCTFDASNTKPMPAALADGSVMALGDLGSAKATVTLTATTGCSYAGTAIISNLSFTRDVAGKLETSGDLQFTGPITQTWDETP